MKARGSGAPRLLLMHGLEGTVRSHYVAPFFNEFVVSADSPEARNTTLLKHKIIGGLPLGRFYPELSAAMLAGATEMSRRQDMERLAEVI